MLPSVAIPEKNIYRLFLDRGSQRVDVKLTKDLREVIVNSRLKTLRTKAFSKVFFIICQEKPFGKLPSMIAIKGLKNPFLRNLAKREIQRS